MNIRNHLIEIQCTKRDVPDVTKALVHSLLFFRTHGKFNYKHEGSYSIGTLGYERAYCDLLDFNYIRSSSPTFIQRTDSKIQEFVDRFNDLSRSGSLTLEFYTKRPNRWPFNDSKIIWEIWIIKLCMNISNSINALPIIEQHHFQRETEPAIRLEDVLSHKLIDIIRIVNSDRCSLPAMPTQPNLDTVFDTSYSDLQPYLHQISYKISETTLGSYNNMRPNTNKYTDGNVVVDSSNHSSFKKFLLDTLEL